MKRIYFLPRYIAALKYYEKLFPALEKEGFTASFLLLEDLGMAAYCKERSLSCDTRFLSHTSIHIPFITPLIRELRLQKEFEAFIREAPTALVTEPGIPEHIRTLFKKAHEKGVRTAALQWAQHTSAAKDAKRSLKSRYLAKIERHGSVFSAAVFMSYYFLLRKFMAVVDFLAGGDVFVHKEQYAEYLGVVDERTREYFCARGWKKNQVQIVGFADYTLMNELSRRVREEPNFRKTLFSRYGLSDTKKHILVLSTPFYTGSAVVFTDAKGQEEYFSKIVDDIESVFPHAEAEILFKLHPREKDVYASLRARGVKTYHNEANTDELIALADAYVAHPMTGANFIVRASSTPALFLNFTPLEFLDVGKELYDLRSIAKTHEEFRHQLFELRRGSLPLQYNTEGVDTDSLSNIISFVVGTKGA